ncbi:hypothetical protein TIFTF001_029693 [Ficus carica]|uniref:Uncharacterized protein n=1 Tax=Ficus carica TaxID=3494 RepID=A0AA88J2S1_FICCA|nr:hypothetical protein TIFTF001_029693 [Ficus carica]
MLTKDKSLGKNENPVSSKKLFDRFGPWFELDKAGRPNHSMAACQAVLAERKLTTYVYAVDPKIMDEDHTAAYAFHGMLPLIFDGTRRTVSLAAWLHDMESIFRICHIAAHLQVPIASRFLALDARLWWRTIGEPKNLGGSWEEFCALIIARYGPLPDGDAVMPYRDPEIYNDMNFGRYLN